MLLELTTWNFSGNITDNPKMWNICFVHIRKNYTFAPAEIKVCVKVRSDGGMVDTQDLKSCDHNGCAGSSPAPSTIMEVNWFTFSQLTFLFLILTRKFVRHLPFGYLLSSCIWLCLLNEARRYMKPGFILFLSLCNKKRPKLCFGRFLYTFLDTNL